MDAQFLIIVVLIFVTLLVGFFIYKKLSEITKNKVDDNLVEWLKTMQTSIDNTSKTLNESLHNSNQNITTTLHANTRALNERLDNAAKVIAAVQKNIGEMSEIGRGMQELQDFLKSPKLRGNIGEQVLKELLGQMLPKKSFHLQYSFKSGFIVDAAIQTEAGIIPIDSKFPMENFKKLAGAHDDKERKIAEKEFLSDVKKHIDAISKKYILPGEGTIDYGLMYVPSESVYYEIINSSELFDYAASKRVLPVSPMTFYAYLKAILMGFEGQKISKQAKDILSGIRSIQKEYQKVEDNVEVLNKHINNSYNTMNNVRSGFSKLGHEIASTGSLEREEEKLIDETNS
ncbi:MAG: hypothetical protein COU27_03455 [Candidatus Levybacteria bacterium CG10_big_fil_rev_8_21_14_0_10_36_7]|nr:MAG: hypothetical protein COU27_03455 [Candidatus Levybacteria bacterium CG10_big_fil_rev_8_21_14_0_10_36_7]